MISHKSDQGTEPQTKRVRRPKPLIDKDEIYRKLRLTPYEAAYLAGISEGLMWRFVSGERKPKCQSVKVGARRLIPRKALDEWMEAFS